MVHFFPFPLQLLNLVIILRQTILVKGKTWTAMPEFCICNISASRFLCFSPQVRHLADIYRNDFPWIQLKWSWVSSERIIACNRLHSELQHRREWIFAFLLFFQPSPPPLLSLEISQPSVSQTESELRILQHWFISATEKQIHIASWLSLIHQVGSKLIAAQMRSQEKKNQACWFKSTQNCSLAASWLDCMAQDLAQCKLRSTKREASSAIGLLRTSYLSFFSEQAGVQWWENCMLGGSRKMLHTTECYYMHLKQTHMYLALNLRVLWHWLLQNVMEAKGMYSNSGSVYSWSLEVT